MEIKKDKKTKEVTFRIDAELISEFEKVCKCRKRTMDKQLSILIRNNIIGFSRQHDPFELYSGKCHDLKTSKNLL